MIPPPPGAFPDELWVPGAPDVTCEGFAPEAFEILDRLRAAPHIAQYRLEKEGVQRWIQEPFRRFRDDLVVNAVLPNRLPLETERNVFSRLLKNDFGAGGCHHHLWMAFYRPHRRRLTDVQLAFAVRPEGFDATLFVGEQARDVFRRARARILDDPASFLRLLNPLLQDKAFVVRPGDGGKRLRFDAPLASVPDAMRRARSFWIRAAVPRADAERLGGGIVAQALAHMRGLWPLYRYFLEET